MFFDFISKGATDTFAGMKKEALRRKELYNHTKRIAEIQEINDSTNEKLLHALQFWDHPLESNQWGESHEYEKWLNSNVEPTIEKANSKLNPLGRKLAMTPAVAELYEKCQNRLYDLRSKDKAEMLDFAQDYLDELEEAGFTNLELKVSDDLMEVVLEAADPSGIRFKITGGSTIWGFPLHNVWEVRYAQSLYGIYKPGNPPHATVLDEDFKCAFRIVVRNVRTMDWSNALHSFEPDRRYEKCFIDDVVYVSENTIRLHAYELPNCFKRFEFKIILDPTHFETIADHLLDDAIRSLRDAGFIDVKADGGRQDQKIAVSATDSEGMRFQIHCETIDKGSGFVTSNPVFCKCVLGLMEAIASVVWVEDSAPDQFKDALHANNILPGDIEKTGLCTFTTLGRMEVADKSFHIKVRIDRQDFISRKSAFNESQAAARNQQRRDFANRLIATMEDSFNEDNWRSSKDALINALDVFLKAAEDNDCIISGFELKGYAAVAGERDECKIVTIPVEKSGMETEITLITDSPVSDGYAISGMAALFEQLLACDWERFPEELIDRFPRCGHSINFLGKSENGIVGRTVSDGIAYHFSIFPDPRSKKHEIGCYLKTEDAYIALENSSENDVEETLILKCSEILDKTPYTLLGMKVEGIPTEDEPFNAHIKLEIIGPEEHIYHIHYSVVVGDTSIDAIDAFKACVRCFARIDWNKPLASLEKAATELGYVSTCMEMYSDTLYFQGVVDDRYCIWKCMIEDARYELSTTSNDFETFSIDDMDGFEFEHFCAKVLRFNGFFDVEVTPSSGDQGIDIIATKNLIKYGFQCKCYSEPVGNKAIQEAFTGKKFYGCHLAVVLTNSRFTSAAEDLAEKIGVVLWDRDMLLELVKNTKQ